VALTPQTSIVLPRNCRAIDPWKSRKNWLRNIQLPLGICSFFTHLMRRAFDRPSAGVCDSHSHDLDRVVASLFAINRRYGAPGEHKACYHLSREALGHQFRIGSTTQAGVGQYSERTAPLGLRGISGFPQAPLGALTSRLRLH
jgi:hypothetical protein